MRSTIILLNTKTARPSVSARNKTQPMETSRNVRTVSGKSNQAAAVRGGDSSARTSRRVCTIMITPRRSNLARPKILRFYCTANATTAPPTTPATYCLPDLPVYVIEFAFIFPSNLTDQSSLPVLESNA
jgi:hypothetical protein